jgi:hypothetical protein
MAEISNTTLAVLVFAALVVVVAGTVLNMNSWQGGLTGFATSDSGNVSLSVSSTLAIQVNSSFNTINFTSCTPRGGSSYWCATNDSQYCDGTAASANGNCTGDGLTPQYLQVDNVGNVNATVNVTSECDAAELIGGTSPAFQFMTTNCEGTAVSSWTNFNNNLQQSACTALVPSTGRMRLYVNVTIPNNAVGGTTDCSDNKSTLTFTATT